MPSNVVMRWGDCRRGPGSEVFELHELDAACALLDEQTPIKKLFMLLEMARHGGGSDGGGGGSGGDGGGGGVVEGGKIPLERWISCMEDLAG